MVDPISAATGLVGLIRTVSELLSKIKDKSVRGEFQEKLFQLRAEAIRLQEENAALRDENRKLRDAATDRVDPADYERRGNAYWKSGTPYCMRCMEEDRKERTLAQIGEYSTQGYCPACKRRYNAVFQAKPMPGPVVVKPPPKPPRRLDW